MNIKTIVFITSVVLGLTVHASDYNSSSNLPTIIVWFANDNKMKKSDTQLIVAAWNNGDMIWSTNTIYGGEPYLYSKASESNDVFTALTAFQNKGYFSPEFSVRNFGPDSSYIGIFISSGTNVLYTRSWHEIFEQNQNLIALSSGITTLDGRNKEIVLQDDKAEYLKYRAMWADIRFQINNIPKKNGRVVENVMIRRHEGIQPITITHDGTCTEKCMFCYP